MRPWSLATGSTTRADGVRRLQFRHAQWPRRTKDAAHFITRSNDEDAVMHTILQLFALQRQGA